MTELANYQFEIDGVVFGKGAPIATDATGFDRGSDEIESQDAFIRGSESLAMGVDGRKPSAWSWEAHTDTAEFPDEALADLAQLERAWKNPEIRLNPSAVSKLRYRVANRTRHVYGRPRRFSATTTNELLGGLSRVLMDFQRSSNLYFDDELRTEQISAIPAEPIGFWTPLEFPLSTLAGSPRQGTIAEGGGNVPAPFIVTFEGPESGSATYPKIYGDDWSLQLMTTLTPGEIVTVSTYPWGPRAQSSDGANLSGLLKTSAALRDIRIPIDGDTLWFDVQDASGTARAVVSWYPTYDTF